MYITVTNYHINLAGWILFLISAIGFASLALVVIGRCLTAFFLIMCLAFMAPFSRCKDRSKNTPYDQENTPKHQTNKGVTSSQCSGFIKLGLK